MRYELRNTTQSGIGNRIAVGTYAEMSELQKMRAAELRAAKVGPIMLRIFKSK